MSTLVMPTVNPAPCPFCGGEKLIVMVGVESRSYIDCSCGARGPRTRPDGGADLAVELWNLRDKVVEDIMRSRGRNFTSGEPTS